LRTVHVRVLNEAMETEPPVARALHALELIQVQPGITGDEIARRLGVSTRAARRHVSTLRAAGFTIGSTPGPGGGYRIARGTRMPLIFTSEELLSLAMALSEVPEAASEGEAGTAVAKILRAVPSRVAAPAQSLLEAATAMPSARTPRPRPHIVLELASAIDHAQRLEIDYRAASDDSTGCRIVEPWAVVVRHGRWYLLGRSTAHEAVRTYRIDRIAAVRTRDEAFERPADLDTAAAFEEHLHTGWTHATTVDIRAGIEEVRPWIPASMGALTPTGPRTCRLVGTTDNCAAYLLDLARTPFGFTITGGAELRAAAEELAGRLADAARGSTEEGRRDGGDRSAADARR
jgi:predicted DNA-binding transcriptional regulator YafY